MLTIPRNPQPFAGIAAVVAYPLLPQITLSGLDLTGTLFLMVVAASLPGLFRRFKAIAIDRAVGELSYPLYLVHFPVLILLPEAAPLMICAVSLAAAAALHVAVELPLDGWRSRRSGPV